MHVNTTYARARSGASERDLITLITFTRTGSRYKLVACMTLEQISLASDTDRQKLEHSITFYAQKRITFYAQKLRSKLSLFSGLHQALQSDAIIRY